MSHDAICRQYPTYKHYHVEKSISVTFTSDDKFVLTEVTTYQIWWLYVQRSDLYSVSNNFCMMSHDAICRQYPAYEHYHVKKSIGVTFTSGEEFVLKEVATSKFGGSTFNGLTCVAFPTIFASYMSHDAICGQYPGYKHDHVKKSISVTFKSGDEFVLKEVNTYQIWWLYIQRSDLYSVSNNFCIIHVT
ncbi:hypothetical protein AVEN_165521-1 [Araneus ventricosus]|uniref:Uncharacterized protein n=1 Tax=Araneus ventricosus TaxID=182803 RepID=A0A4Y2SQ75_ARAVE|nr:hypothetical protein AVEN_165521-1 [Araneus ventricosus]